MNTETSERYWLVWSARQSNIHVETESSGVATNREAFRLDQHNDHITIGVFGSQDDALAEADRLRPIAIQRDAKRPSST